MSNNKIGKHKTVISSDDAGVRRVLYHDTYVVTMSSSIIMLNSGGYLTRTTKLRMNQASQQYGLGYLVYQARFAWFVDYHDKTYPFADRMTLDRKSGVVRDRDGIVVPPVEDK